jgi:hypothetical protein
MPAGVRFRQKLIGDPKVLVFTPAFRRCAVVERPYGPPPITIVSNIRILRPGSNDFASFRDDGTSSRFGIRAPGGAGAVEESFVTDALRHTHREVRSEGLTATG